MNSSAVTARCRVSAPSPATSRRSRSRRRYSRCQQRAQETLGGDLNGVVITVPAYFDDAQRQATKDAARLAGLHVYRLLNEPTAAAVAYGLDRGADGVHAIYDLGGGTFDISVLRLHNGVFEVMATGGDTALGGDDFDAAVAGWLLEQAGVARDADRGTLRHVLDQARAAKEALAVHSSTPVEIALPGDVTWRGELSRPQLAQLIAPFVRKTINTCRRVLRDAGVTPDQIEDVVMVGGSTRTLHVREQVGEFFGREPWSTSIRTVSSRSARRYRPTCSPVTSRMTRCCCSTSTRCRLASRRWVD